MFVVDEKLWYQDIENIPLKELFRPEYSAKFIRCVQNYQILKWIHGSNYVLIDKDCS